MIVPGPYPICEFDADGEPLIKPGDFLTKTLPPKCVVTFFRKELTQLVEQKELPVIGQLHSEVLDIPIYRYSDEVCITMPFSTAPGAACTIEELHAMGCQQFLICGAAGALEPGSAVGEIVVPLSAVRDEGTSYHYLAPSREVECQPAAAQAVLAELKRMGIPHRTGKTWTTDALYRETPALVTKRRSEGCITVEMETAAFFAVSRYYNLPLVQLLYAGDDVSGAQWMPRDWDRQQNVRANLIAAALKLAEKL